MAYFPNSSVGQAGSSTPVYVTQVGGTDGSLLQPLQVFDADTGAGQQYVVGVTLRTSAPGGSIEIGTAANPLRTDPTGTTSQPVTDAGGSLTIDSTQLPPLLGLSTMANSLPVVIASNQSPISVNDGGSTLTIDTAQLPDTLGQLVKAESLSITIASDHEDIGVSSTQLPAALVGGRLDNNIGSWLGDITPTVGQKAMASSIPIVVASDQTAVPMSDAGGSLTIDTTQLPSTLGPKTSSFSLSVTLASDLGSIPVSDGASSLTIDTTQLPGSLVGGRLDANVGSWLGSELPTVGTKVSASSIPVVLASDHSSVPVGDGGGSLTIDSAQLPSSLVSGRLDSNVGSWLGSTAPSVGQKVAASSIPVVLASDSSLAISDGGGSLTIDSTQLPAALVSGRLDSNLGAWLGSTSPSVGQKAMASSIPVAIASDQTPVPDYSASGSMTGAAQTVTISSMNGVGSATLTITGTWTGSILVEGSSDGGTTWTTLDTQEIGSPHVFSSWSTNVVARVVTVAGLTHIRARSVTLSSGTATVALRATSSSSIVYTQPVALLSDSPKFAARDAFGRWRTSDPVTIFDSKHIYDKQPLLWDESLTSASSTFSAANARVQLSIANLTAGTAIRQTFRYFNYQPGKGALIFLTFCGQTGASGITRRVGQFDGNNGLFLAQAGTTLSVNVRTQSGAGNQSVNQSSWNLDKMDGTGPSRVNIDFSKTQILVIDYEWLGVGSVRFGFVVDGIIYYCHQFRNANSLSTVYMSTPNLPLRYELVNDGTGPASTFDHICSSVITEGGRSDLGLHYSINRGLAASVLALSANGTEYCMAAIRLQSGRQGAYVVPKSLSLVTNAATGGAVTLFRWRLLRNPTFTGALPAWTPVTNSSVEYVHPANTVTITGSGTEMQGGYFSEISPTIALPDVADVALGTSIGGTADIIAIGITSIEGTAGSNSYGTLSWSEVP